MATKTSFIFFLTILLSSIFFVSATVISKPDSVRGSSCDSSRYPPLMCDSLLASENYFSARQSHHHHHHHHHRHNHHNPPPKPVPEPATSSTPNQPSPREFPSPPPPAPETRSSGPDTAEGSNSLTDVIKDLRRSKRSLHLPGLQGNGIHVGDALIVSKDGSGDFSSIGEAIKAVPENIIEKDGYFVIYIKRGVYEEYLEISREKTYVMLLGDGINETILTGNRSKAGDGLEAYHTGTLSVYGAGFMAMGVTIRNTYGPGSQAAAIMNRANQSAFFRCSIEGYQDTLYAHSGTQFYRECDVYGSIDFIFGNAAAVFQKCHIIARHPGKGGRVVLTGQGRESMDGRKEGATSFHNCTVDAVEPGVGPAFLGRPWKPFARVAYMKSYLGEMVDPVGWSPMEGSTDNVYYGEYGNTGPGSNTDKRVTWPGVRTKLSDSEAELFTVDKLTNGGAWLPRTDIPFSLGIEPLI